MMRDNDCVDKLVELLTNFPSLKIPIGDLRKLSTDTVVAIYQESLKALGINIRNLRKPLKSETQFHESYYDIDFRFIMKLHAVLALLLKETTDMEFDVMDILNPGVNRTYAAVAFLYNLTVFRIARKEELDELIQQGSEGIVRKSKLVAHKERLGNEINYQSKQKAELTILHDQLKNQISDAEVRVFSLIEEREKIKESLEPLSKTLAEYDGKIRKPETESMKLMQQIEKLKNQIVTSPDQLVHNLETLRAAEQQKKEQQLSISKELQEKKSHFEKLANCAQVANAVYEELKYINKLIDEIRNEEKQLALLEAGKTNLTEEVCKKKEVIEWIKNNEAELQQRIKSLEECLADKNQEVRKKMTELDKETAQEARAVEEYKCSMQVHTKEIEECKIKITKEEEHISYVLLKIKKEAQAIIQEVKELTHTFNHISQSIAELQSK